MATHYLDLSYATLTNTKVGGCGMSWYQPVLPLLVHQDCIRELLIGCLDIKWLSYYIWIKIALKPDHNAADMDLIFVKKLDSSATNCTSSDYRPISKKIYRKTLKVPADIEKDPKKLFRYSRGCFFGHLMSINDPFMKTVPSVNRYVAYITCTFCVSWLCIRFLCAP